MTISLIAAVAANGTIGSQNDLPWHLPDDASYFKHTTLGHPIIMGRKSFEALGKPLPRRTNIVITRQTDWKPAVGEGVIVVSSLADALVEACKVETDEIFVIGGAEIYALALPIATRLYLTEIDKAYDGDAYFPTFDRATWHEASRKPHPADDRHAAAFDFVVYERNKVID
jgi:dihydrofolate reductase